MKQLELLSPAKNAEVAREAILHGADAVYMGASSHGARANALNSIDDIRRTVEIAHTYRAKVYVTVNTLVYENELRQVERLVYDLWRAGADALIVQDMSLLRLDIPPIALHASTQCDNRTPEKAKFLEEVGFSQIVLARELTLSEIENICRSVTVPVECFVHGALCVSYSGRCHASFAACGRSANRGQCAQLCRLPYDLIDSKGNILIQNRHLLSLKDFNLSDRIGALIEAGVSSFKIEGRLKDADYVKNVTASYRNIIDKYISEHPDKYERSSFGNSEFTFKPNLDKSFNRSFTHYFLDERKPENITSPLTPKSMGETITDVSMLNNGDGISFFDRSGNYLGALVNGIDRGRIINSRNLRIPWGAEIHRTSDVRWDSLMSARSAVRKLNLVIAVEQTSVTARDERGVKVILPLPASAGAARKPMDIKRFFAKLGDTPYQLRNFSSTLPVDYFLPASRLTNLRRELCAALDKANRATYQYSYRRNENLQAVYPDDKLDFHDNVANSLARRFYHEHGVRTIEAAAEKTGIIAKGADVMTARHCILRENGLCRKEKGKTLQEPLFLKSNGIQFRLSFDCSKCEMKLHTISERR